MQLATQALQMRRLVQSVGRPYACYVPADCITIYHFGGVYNRWARGHQTRRSGGENEGDKSVRGGATHRRSHNRASLGEEEAGHGIASEPIYRSLIEHDAGTETRILSATPPPSSFFNSLAQRHHHHRKNA